MNSTLKSDQALLDNDSNLHFRMNINAQFNSINQETDNSIVHDFRLRKTDCNLIGNGFYRILNRAEN